MARKVIIGSDVQYPYYDKRVYQGFLNFVREQAPDDVVLNGDVFDFYALAKYDKDPGRAVRLQQELDGLHRWVIGPLSDVAPNSVVWILEGNHEERLKRYLWGRAPELVGLRGVTVRELYRTEEHHIIYLETGKVLELGHLLVMHGHLISKHSGQTARLHFERHGTSVLTGHSHRLGAFFKTDHHGTHGAWECGCLSSLHPEYDPYPNWQQGWAVVTVWPDKKFNVELVPVINRKLYIYGGKEYKI